MSHLSAVVAAVAVAVSGAGCASQLSMVKSDNARLRTMLTELRADKRRVDRKVRELENELAASSDRPGRLAIDRARAAAPVLPVEVLAPAPDDGLAPGQRIVGIAEDGTAIIYEGDAALGTGATWDDQGVAPPRRSRPPPSPDDRIATTHDRIPRVAAAPERAGAAAAERYRHAVDQLRRGQHDEAVDELRELVRRYPGHDLADNAQYWIGEAFYARKDYVQALAEFRIAVDKYPRGNKVPDALLKVGYCHLALRETAKGRFALEQVMTIYPKTEPALLAEKRLETIAP